MQFFSFLCICFMCLFFGVIAPKIYVFFIICYVGHPLFTAFFCPFEQSYTFKAMLISCFAICSILPVFCYSQITKPIIRFYSVNMVNQSKLAIIGHVKPSQSVRGIISSIIPNVRVPFVMLVASGFILQNSFPWFYPSEKTSARVIGKKIFDGWVNHGVIYN